MKALHCYKPAERRCKVVHLLAAMCTYEILFNVTETTDTATTTSAEHQVEPLAQILVVVVVKIVVN